MTDQELRALVRDAIAKSGIGPAGRPGAAHGGAEAPPYGRAQALPYTVTGDTSHAMFMLPPGDPEGRCVIEPGVQCNHCGYCKSYGH